MRPRGRHRCVLARAAMYFFALINPPYIESGGTQKHGHRTMGICLLLNFCSFYSSFFFFSLLFFSNYLILRGRGGTGRDGTNAGGNSNTGRDGRKQVHVLLFLFLFLSSPLFLYSLFFHSDYSWIARPVQTHTKIICQGTEKATTDSRLRTKSSRRGASIGAVIQAPFLFC